MGSPLHWDLGWVGQMGSPLHWDLGWVGQMGSPVYWGILGGLGRRYCPDMSGSVVRFEVLVCSAWWFCFVRWWRPAQGRGVNGGFWGRRVPPRGICDFGRLGGPGEIGCAISRDKFAVSLL